MLQPVESCSYFRVNWDKHSLSPCCCCCCWWWSSSMAHVGSCFSLFGVRIAASHPKGQENRHFYETCAWTGHFVQWTLKNWWWLVSPHAFIQFPPPLLPSSREPAARLMTDTYFSGLGVSLSVHGSHFHVSAERLYTYSVHSFNSVEMKMVHIGHPVWITARVGDIHVYSVNFKQFLVWQNVLLFCHIVQMYKDVWRNEFMEETFCISATECLKL